MAAFKNKANGTWYVQFRYTDWKGERQQKLKRGFATKKEAQAWEREFLMQKQADVNMTFESFAQLYEKDMKPKLKLNTWLTKESIIQKKILPYFGKRKLSEITAKDVMDWQNAIRGLTDAKGKPYTLQTGFGRFDAVRVNAEGEILGFDKAVVALCQLVLQHGHVLNPNTVKVIPLERNGNGTGKSLFGCCKIQKR